MVHDRAFQLTVVAAAIAFLVLALATGAAAALEDNSLTTSPATPGDESVHTHQVTVEEDDEIRKSPVDVIEVDYGDDLEELDVAGDDISVEVLERYRESRPMEVDEVTSDGETATIDVDPSTAWLREGDRVTVVVNDESGSELLNPATPGDYTAELTFESLDAGSDSVDNPYSVVESTDHYDVFEVEWEYSGNTYMPVPTSDDLDVTATIDNTGDEEGVQDVEFTLLDDSGEVHTEVYEDMTLGPQDDPDDSPSATFDPQADGIAPGNYDLRITTDNDTFYIANNVDFVDDEVEFFDIRVTDATDNPVSAGASFDVDVSVKNVGPSEGTQSVVMDFGDDGDVDDQEDTVSLSEGDESEYTFNHDTGGESGGEYDVRTLTDNHTDYTLAVVESDEDGPEFEIDIENTNSPVQAGDVLDVDVEVTNTGGESDTQTIELEDFEGDVVDEVETTLDEDEGSTVVSLTWETEQGDADTDEVIASSDDDSDRQDVTVEEDGDAEFEVDIVSSNSPVDEGDTLSVDVDVSNAGEVAGEQDISLDVDGQQRDETSVSLDEGGSTTVTLSWNTESGDAGEHSATASSEDDSDFEEVEVKEGGEEDEDDADDGGDGDQSDVVFEVDVVSSNSPVEQAATLEVDANVTNTGDEADTQTVELEDFDGDVVDDSSVELDPEGDHEIVTLTWTPEEDDVGSDDVIVSSDDDSDTETVEVESSDDDDEEGDAEFEVEFLSSNGPVEEGSTLTVDAEVSNTGDEEGEQDVSLEVLGQDQDETSVTLGSGDTTVVTLSWNTESGDSGEHSATVYTEDDSDVGVVEVETDDDADDGVDDDDDAAAGGGGHHHGGNFSEASFSATVEVSPSSPEAGDTVEVGGEVENTGGQEDTATVEIVGEDSVVESTTVSLIGYQSETVSLEHVPEANPGEFEVQVDEDVVETYEVESDEADVDDEADEADVDDEADEADAADDDDEVDGEADDADDADDVDDVYADVEEEDEGLPGFTVVTALAALLATAYAVRRRR